MCEAMLLLLRATAFWCFNKRPRSHVYASKSHSDIRWSRASKQTNNCCSGQLFVMHDTLPAWLDSLRRSSVKIGTMQRILAWPLRKDDTHKSRSVNIFWCCVQNHPAFEEPIQIAVSHRRAHSKSPFNFTMLSLPGSGVYGGGLRGHQEPRPTDSNHDNTTITIIILIVVVVVVVVVVVLLLLLLLLLLMIMIISTITINN